MDYCNIPVSTYTFVVKSNILVNMEVAVSKFKESIKNEYGKISGIKYSGDVSKKNMHNKPIQSFGDSSNGINFLHACTIRYKHPDKAFDKPINVKIYNNGSMHITGCKKMNHCFDTISAIFNILKAHKNIVYYTEPTTIFRIYTTMKNVHFRFSFCINRHKLINFFKKHDNFGYIISYDDQIMTGLNIKKQLTSVTDTIHVMEWNRGLAPSTTQTGICPIPRLNQKFIGINQDEELPQIYTQKIPVEYDNLKTITFIVFYSGVCRFSGTNDQFMMSAFYEFIKIIQDNKHEYADMDTKTSGNRIEHIPLMGGNTPPNLSVLTPLTNELDTE